LKKIDINVFKKAKIKLFVDNLGVIFLFGFFLFTYQLFSEIINKNIL